MTEILIYAAILTICVFAVIAVMAWLNDALEEINRQERRGERLRRHRVTAQRERQYTDVEQHSKKVA